MPLRAARVGRVGVIGHPVAKTAVVAKAVSPGPSPVAKTGVVAAAVTPAPPRRALLPARVRADRPKTLGLEARFAGAPPSRV